MYVKIVVIFLYFNIQISFQIGAKIQGT